jgi:hypothetical protein
MPEGWKFHRSGDEHVSAAGIIGRRGRNNGTGEWYNHMPGSEIREKVCPSVWDSYFKFCVIRNPFDKLVSAFYFFDRERPDKHRWAGGDWKDWLKRRYGRSESLDSSRDNRIERFRSWVRKRGSSLDRHLYTIDGKVCVDYCIRFENLHQDIQHVCGVLDIPFAPERITSLKSGIRAHDIALGDYYDAETINIVSDLYGFELERFGYGQPTGTSGSTIISAKLYAPGTGYPRRAC